MKVKKLTSLFLALTMLTALALPARAEQGGSLIRPVSAEPPAPEPTPAPAVRAEGEDYFDTVGHYAAGAIKTWSDYGVLKGYEDGTFRPDGTITRAELAAVLDRIMGYQETAENTFADLPAERWYTDYLLRLAQQGIFNGDEDKNMNPEAPITRQETFAAMARALALRESGEPTGFADDESISDWAKGYVSAMKKAGYIQGDQEGNIRANEPITRAEVVSILNKMVAGFVTTDGVYSKDCKGNLFVKAKDVTLKDMTIDGDLIITDGVGDGNVRLDKVEVKGDVVLRGGGANSIHIQDGSEVDNVEVNKTSGGAIRVANDSAATLPSVEVKAAAGGVILEGNMGDVDIAADVAVDILKGRVKNLTVDAANAAVSVGKEAKADKVELADTATDAELTVEGTVTDLVTNAAARVTNNGKLSSVKAQASGLVIEGKKPARVTAAAGVKAPVDANGKKVVASAAASYSSSSSSAPPPAPTATPPATPAPDTTVTPAPDTTVTPAPDTTVTPAPDTTVTPTPDTTATPVPDTTPTPTPCAHKSRKVVEESSKAASCSELGLSVTECQSCGEIFKEEISLRKHSYGTWVKEDYGYESDWYIWTATCTVCGTVGRAEMRAGYDPNTITEPDPNAGMIPGLGEPEPSGCTYHLMVMVGDYTYSDYCSQREYVTRCKFCGETRENVETIHGGGWHDMVWNKDEKEPTCTEPGSIETGQCSRCGKRYPEDMGGPAGPIDPVIPAKGHDYGDWVYDPDNNTRTRTCKVCGETDTEENIV